MRELWLRKTNHNSDAFLCDILKFLGQLSDEEDFGSSTESTSYFYNELGECVGKMHTSAKQIIITKVSNQIKTL